MLSSLSTMSASPVLASFGGPPNQLNCRRALPHPRDALRPLELWLWPLPWPLIGIHLCPRCVTACCPLRWAPPPRCTSNRSPTCRASSNRWPRPPSLHRWPGFGRRRHPAQWSLAPLFIYWATSTAGLGLAIIGRCQHWVLSITSQIYLNNSKSKFQTCKIHRNLFIFNKIINLILYFEFKIIV
jgi:hypothetical protein